MTDSSKALQMSQENALAIAGIKAWMEGHDKLCEERTKNLEKGMDEVHKTLKLLLKISTYGGGAVLALLLSAVVFLLTHPEVSLIK